MSNLVIPDLIGDLFLGCGCANWSIASFELFFLSFYIVIAGLTGNRVSCHAYSENSVALLI